MNDLLCRNLVFFFYLLSLLSQVMWVYKGHIYQNLLFPKLFLLQPSILKSCIRKVKHSGYCYWRSPPLYNPPLPFRNEVPPTRTNLARLWPGSIRTFIKLGFGPADPKKQDRQGAGPCEIRYDQH